MDGGGRDRPARSRAFAFRISGTDRGAAALRALGRRTPEVQVRRNPGDCSQPMVVAARRAGAARGDPRRFAMA